MNQTRIFLCNGSCLPSGKKWNRQAQVEGLMWQTLEYAFIRFLLLPSSWSCEFRPDNPWKLLAQTAENLEAASKVLDQLFMKVRPIHKTAVEIYWTSQKSQWTFIRLNVRIWTPSVGNVWVQHVGPNYMVIDVNVYKSPHGFGSLGEPNAQNVSRPQRKMLMTV